jgi:hypothetical protein
MLAVAAIPVAGADPCKELSAAGADARTYVHDVLASGGSESAIDSIRTIAAIQLEDIALSFDKVDGTLQTGFMSGFCPKPGMTAAEVEKLRAPMNAAIERQTKRLVIVADSDRSGFVSTKEGSTFREVVIGGLQIEAALGLTNKSQDEAAKLLGISAEVLRRRAREFDQLLPKVNVEDDKPWRVPLELGP